MSIDISCPFCNKTIVEAYDIEDAYNDETEEYDEIPEDYRDGKCPHLSFFSDWAYAGSRIEDKWINEMYIFSRILNLYNNEEIDEALIMKIKNEEIEKNIDYFGLSFRDKEKLAHRIGNRLMDNEEFCQELLKNAFPNYETYLETSFVDKGDGVHGCGGPTYMCIFLKER